MLKISLNFRIRWSFRFNSRFPKTAYCQIVWNRSHIPFYFFTTPSVGIWTCKSKRKFWENLTSKFSKNSINFSLFLKSVRATPNGLVGLATFLGMNVLSCDSNRYDHVTPEITWCERNHVTMWDNLWDDMLHCEILKLRNSSSEAKDYSKNVSRSTL